MSFPNIIHIAAEEAFNEYTVERYPVGSCAVAEDGRAFRFAEVGASTALVIGNMTQGAAPAADTLTEIIDTLAAGVTVLTGVGSTSNPQAIDVLKYGYIHTDNATTLPLSRIKSNTALAANGTGTVTLFDPTRQAIAAANTVSYYKNLWRDVIQGVATTPTAMPTGVARLAAAVNDFCWLQTKGPSSVLYSSTTTAIAAVGDPVQMGVAAGAVGGIPTVGITQIVGHLLGMVEGDTEQCVIFLCID